MNRKGQSATAPSDDSEWTTQELALYSLVVVFLALWCGAVFSPTCRAALQAGGDSVAAVATIAGAAATFFALQQLQEQRSGAQEQREALEKQLRAQREALDAQLRAQREALDMQLRAQAAAVREDHRLQHVAVLREKWALVVSAYLSAGEALIQAQQRQAPQDKFVAALFRLAAARDVIDFVDPNPQRAKLASLAVDSIAKAASSQDPAGAGAKKLRDLSGSIVYLVRESLSAEAAGDDDPSAAAFAEFSLSQAATDAAKGSEGA